MVHTTEISILHIGALELFIVSKTRQAIEACAPMIYEKKKPKNMLKYIFKKLKYHFKKTTAGESEISWNK